MGQYPGLSNQERIMTTKTTSKAPSNSNEKMKSNGANSSELMELFEEQLKDILWAEKALIKAIPKMIKLAESDDLILALTDHLKETHEQVTRLAKIFKSIDKKPRAVKCDAMEGLIEEATEMLEDCGKGPGCDAGIIAAAQKIEHYEIATYGTLREFAETLALSEALVLLTKTLKEEKDADQKLTDVAKKEVNSEAASLQSQES